MIKIIFKEVGQGDSIIIEWEDSSNQLHTGIIDCNKNRGVIPAIEHLRNSTSKIVDFIILSHPHTDHFSGMRMLLEYCIKSKIKIGRFLHTCYSTPEFLKTFVNDSVDGRQELDLLFKRASELHKKGLLKMGYVSDDFKQIPLAHGFALEFLSPSATEFAMYSKVAFKKKNITEKNNADANILCTLIKISNPNGFVLLTADADKKVFQRIQKKGALHIKDVLFMTQIPHHGSEKNFNGSFWNSINYLSYFPAVVSVGMNEYGHPSSTTLDAYRAKNADIFSTNDYNNFPEESLDDQDLLTLTGPYDDFEQDYDSPSQLQGDKVFILKDDQILYLQLN